MAMPAEQELPTPCVLLLPFPGLCLLGVHPSVCIHPSQLGVGDARALRPSVLQIPMEVLPALFAYSSFLPF